MQMTVGKVNNHLRSFMSCGNTKNGFEKVN